MSAAAAGSAVPAQLDLLRHTYLELPPPKVRFTVVPGLHFLSALDAALTIYPVKQVADALGVSTTSVYKMRQKNRRRPWLPWPSETEVAPLLRVWRTIESARIQNRKISRNSREFARVHRALASLLQKYEIHVIAMAIKVDQRSLERYRQSPLTAPRSISAAVRRAVPRTDSGPRAASPD